MHRPGARELVELVLDDGSFTSWDAPVDLSGLPEGYRAELTAAAERSGTDEAVITGRGRVDGLDVAVVVGEFRFLGGSIGAATAARITSAVRRATAEGLPLVAAPASGGTRMQEGTPAFVEMVTISRAVTDHKAAGLPYVVYLRHPTTGGVFASWGSLGHVTVAEPDALVGFLGPKVYEALNDRPFPEGVQVAENLVERGVIDAVVPTDELAGLAARVIRLLHPSRRDRPQPVPTPPADDAAVTGAADVWESVLLTRRPDRPGVRELLRHGADDVLRLHGTGTGEQGAGLLLALTSFGGHPCVLVGQDRLRQAQRSLGPAGLRAAQRGMHLAQELRLPLVTVIDTPGADLSVDAEEGALAGEIARCIAEMTRLTVPTVSVVLGEGCGGAALALLPAPRVLVAGNGWLAPLPPEGASVIRYGDVEHAADMTRAQRISAQELLKAGIAHVVVPEAQPAHLEPEEFCRRVAAYCAAELAVTTDARDPSGE